MAALSSAPFIPEASIGEAEVEVYKPSLRVDVMAEPPDENGNSTGTTPKASITPHVSTNIFVAGIPVTWEETDLARRFQEFGEIISTKIVKRKHFGFVMFRRPESAHAAINAMHLTHPTPNSQAVLHVSIAMHDEGVDDVPNDRIFIRGLPQWATKEHVRQCFLRFGTIIDCAVLMNPQGQCKGSGFVQFSSVAAATAAVDDAKSVRIDNCDAELEVKYSETAEVRQQRQERNKNRQKHSPKYRPRQPSLPHYSPPVAIVPSISAIPLLGVAANGAFPMFYSQQPLPPAAPSPHVIYSPVVTPPAIAMYQTAPPVYEAPKEIFPAVGDLHMSGVSLTQPVLLALLQHFGSVGETQIFDSGSSAAARMLDRSLHAIIAQNFNGAIFDGQVLSVGLYA